MSAGEGLIETEAPPARRPRGSMARRGSGTPLDQSLRRRRWRMTLMGLSLAVIVTGLAATGLRPTAVDALDRRPARVVEILDGVTMKVQVVEGGASGEPITLRLLGVKPTAGAEAQCRAKLTDAIAGRAVMAVFDVERLHDEAGTLTAYVYTHDGKLLNEYLLEQRVARVENSSHLLAEWFTRLDRRVNGNKE